MKDEKLLRLPLDESALCPPTSPPEGSVPPCNWCCGGQRSWFWYVSVVVVSKIDAALLSAVAGTTIELACPEYPLGLSVKYSKGPNASNRAR